MPKGVKGSGPRAAGTKPVRAIAVEWKPSAAHEKALAAAIHDPTLVNNSAALAAAIGMHEASIRGWKKDPRWRAWWNQALLEVTREMVGPCVQELQRLVFDPDVPASAKAKLVDTIIKTVGQSKEGDMGSAVLAILERWNPAYGTTKIVATRDAIAAQIEGTRELAQMDQNASMVPPEQLPARSLEEISRVAAQETQHLIRTVEVREAAVDPTMAEHRYSSAPHRPPALARGAGDGGPKSQSVDRNPNGPCTSPLPETSDPSGPETSGLPTPETPDPTSTAPTPPTPPAPEPVTPRLYPHVFSGGKCKRCGFSEGTLSRWCKGPVPAGDNARGPGVAARAATPERDAGLARILRKMKERDAGSGDNA